MAADLLSQDLLELLHQGFQTVQANSQLIPWDNLPAWSIPVLIFLLRASGLTLATLRTLSVLRGRRASAWILGFIQSIIFIVGVVGVLSNLDQWITLVAYALGMATGSAIGMTLEAIYAPGHSTLRVISRTKGNAIADSLRAGNRGVTEITARGLSGTVEIIWCNLRRKDVKKACTEVTTIDDEAFVTVDQVKSLQGGWQA
jgi:uncharacterized protein YebE (UPF0316 family)